MLIWHIGQTVTIITASRRSASATRRRISSRPTFGAIWVMCPPQHSVLSG